MLLITSPENPDIDFKRLSPIHGVGVFALRKFQAGERFLVSHPDFGFNHSCEPNCVIIPGECFVALREIEAGEEMVVFYGWDWGNDCNCPVCRGE